MIKYISEVPNQPTILLDAHADEIAFYVHDINESGYIQIKTLGGSDASIVPSQQMHILYYLLQ